MSDEKSVVQTVALPPIVIYFMLAVCLFMVLIAVGGGVGFYYVATRTPGPTPGPSPAPIAGISAVIVGEHAKVDSAVYESYFIALAQLIESDSTLTQREQANRIVQMTGTVGRRFIKGQYPALGPYMAQQFESWSKSGELTQADKQAMAAKLKMIAGELHTIHD